MFQLTGTLRKEQVKNFTRKDGTAGQVRVLHVEPENDIYPVEVNVSDMELKVGKVGDKVSLPVDVFAYTFENGKRKPALKEVYVPNNTNKKK